MLKRGALWLVLIPTASALALGACGHSSPNHAENRNSHAIAGAPGESNAAGAPTEGATGGAEAGGAATGGAATGGAATGGAEAGASAAGAPAVTGAAGAPAALDGYCGVLVTRLRECSLLSEGRYNCQNYGDQAELCETSCLEEATCAAVSNYYCGRSGDVLKCFHRCYGLEDFTCQSGEVLSPGSKCNGLVQCLSGEDEDDCPVVGYACRNVRQTVPNALVCNGSPDCADGSDELPDCEVVLTCDNRPIPDYAVCDGVKTCNNGADEAPDCAVAMCP